MDGSHTNASNRSASSGALDATALFAHHRVGAPVARQHRRARVGGDHRERGRSAAASHLQDTSHLQERGKLGEEVPSLLEEHPGVVRAVEVVPRARLRLGRGGGSAVLVASFRTATIGAHSPYRRGSVERGHRRTRRGSAAHGGIPRRLDLPRVIVEIEIALKVRDARHGARELADASRGSSVESPRWR